jgi:hypothetical protein
MMIQISPSEDWSALDLFHGLYVSLLKTENKTKEESEEKRKEDAQKATLRSHTPGISHSGKRKSDRLRRSMSQTAQKIWFLNTVLHSSSTPSGVTINPRQRQV